MAEKVVKEQTPQREQRTRSSAKKSQSKEVTPQKELPVPIVKSNEKESVKSSKTPVKKSVDSKILNELEENIQTPVAKSTSEKPKDSTIKKPTPQVSKQSTPKQSSKKPSVDIKDNLNLDSPRDSIMQNTNTNNEPQIDPNNIQHDSYTSSSETEDEKETLKNQSNVTLIIITLLD